MKPCSEKLFKKLPNLVESKNLLCNKVTRLGDVAVFHLLRSYLSQQDPDCNDIVLYGLCQTLQCTVLYCTER